MANIVLMGTLSLCELSRTAVQAAASGVVNVAQSKEQVAPEFNRGLDWFDPGVKKNSFGLAISGDLLLIADGKFGLQIVNIRNPVHPIYLARLATESYTQGYVKEGISVAGNYAFIPLGGWEHSRLLVVDLSSPEKPTVKGQVEFPKMAWGTAVQGNYLYVGVKDFGLRVIDVTEPEKPKLIGDCQFENGLGVCVQGHLAYVANWARGIEIVDVSDPHHPKSLSRCPHPGEAYAVQVVGSFAYVAANNRGLQIIDVSNPNAPRVVGEFDMPDGTEARYGANDVYVEDGFAFVMDMRHGLLIIDVSNPAKPSLFASASGGKASPAGVRRKGPHVFVAAGTNGLQVFEFAAPTLATKTPPSFDNESIAKRTRLASSITETQISTSKEKSTNGASTLVVTNPTLVIKSAGFVASGAGVITLDGMRYFKLTWISLIGWKYTVESATNDLTRWNFVPNGQDIVGTGEELEFRVLADSAIRFFRIRAGRAE